MYMMRDLQVLENDDSNFALLKHSISNVRTYAVNNNIYSYNNRRGEQDMSSGRTAIIMIAGLAIGIVAAVFAGQWIFDAVFRILHPNTSDFWQNLVTLAIAVILTLIVGAVAFGIVVGIFYGVVFLLASKTRRRNDTTQHG